MTALFDLDKNKPFFSSSFCFSNKLSSKYTFIVVDRDVELQFYIWPKTEQNGLYKLILQFILNCTQGKVKNLVIGEVREILNTDKPCLGQTLFG